MKRSWNASVWVGLVVVFAGVASYPLIFIRYPVTRDFPWASLLIMALGLALLAVGISRAFRRPDAYRGKIFGSVLGVLAAAVAAFFCYGVFYATRQLPASHGAPQVGQLAPDFTLPDSTNRPVNLLGTLHSQFWPEGTEPVAVIGIPPISTPPPAAVVLIFYRGYW
ncbi:MAG TPA: hypothetical protein VEJ38_16660 [Candidatus Acidoferrales bacterium]|nr:hypothetical protein [Candidatus Acidoferrales bacterium]